MGGIGCFAETVQPDLQLVGIEFTLRTNTAVSLENTIAQVLGIAAELPFMDTDLSAEGPSPLGDFDLTPTAKRSTIGTDLLQVGLLGPAGLGVGAILTHVPLILGRAPLGRVGLLRGPTVVGPLGLSGSRFRAPTGGPASIFAAARSPRLRGCTPTLGAGRRTGIVENRYGQGRRFRCCHPGLRPDR